MYLMSMTPFRICSMMARRRLRRRPNRGKIHKRLFRDVFRPAYHGGFGCVQSAGGVDRNSFPPLSARENRQMLPIVGRGDAGAPLGYGRGRTAYNFSSAEGSATVGVV